MHGLTRQTLPRVYATLLLTRNATSRHSSDRDHGSRAPTRAESLFEERQSAKAREVGTILRERREALILERETRCVNRPLDAQQRVVPCHARLVVRHVELCALVDDIGDIRHGAQAVSKSGRDPERTRLITAQGNAVPTAKC